jgi:hypothetical protein
MCTVSCALIPQSHSSQSFLKGEPSKNGEIEEVVGKQEVRHVISIAYGDGLFTICVENEPDALTRDRELMTLR